MTQQTPEAQYLLCFVQVCFGPGEQTCNQAAYYQYCVQSALLLTQLQRIEVFIIFCGSLTMLQVSCRTTSNHAYAGIICDFVLQAYAAALA